jgi:hypothetical protein
MPNNFGAAFFQQMETQFTILKRKSEQEKAKILLNKIWKQCEPIMKRHNLKVAKFSEFFPKNPSLLGININRGMHIKIRLRHPRNEDEFLDYHSLLGTMLHELTHNIHSDHSERFYKQLDSFTRELEDVMNGGYIISDDGWVGEGNRLGSSSLRQQNISKRDAMLQAAEKRRSKSFQGGEFRLSESTNIRNALSPRTAAVAAALTRKQILDEARCRYKVTYDDAAESDEDVVITLFIEGKPNDTSDSQEVIILE